LTSSLDGLTVLIIFFFLLNFCFVLFFFFLWIMWIRYHLSSIKAKSYGGGQRCLGVVGPQPLVIGCGWSG